MILMWKILQLLPEIEYLWINCSTCYSLKHVARSKRKNGKILSFVGLITGTKDKIILQLMYVCKVCM